MSKQYFIFYLLIGCLAFPGCASYYQIKVNGYADHKDGPLFPSGTTFLIQEEKTSDNQILAKEITVKLATLLDQRGLKSELQSSKADYMMTFQFGINSGRTVEDVQPVQVTGTTGWIDTYDANGAVTTSTVSFPGYTSYVPRRRTVYPIWLKLKVYAKSGDAAAKGKEVWIGEMSYVSQSDDVREVLNYLLVGGMKYFGQDTKKSVQLKLTERDLKKNSLE